MTNGGSFEFTMYVPVERVPLRPLSVPAHRWGSVLSDLRFWGLTYAEAEYYTKRLRERLDDRGRVRPRK